MSDSIFIYAVRDEDSVQGFILVASETDIDVENTKAEKAQVFHIHSVKNKAYNYTVNKKATTVRLDEFMSLVDDELYEFNVKTRTVVFDKKGYDNLIGQLMDDLDEEQEEESEEDNKKKSNKKPAAKSSSKAKDSPKKTRGRSKKAKESESDSYNADDDKDDDEEKKKPRGRGRPSKKKGDSEEEIEEEVEVEEKTKQKGKRGRPSASAKAPAKKTFKEEKESEDEEDENAIEVEEDEKEVKSASKRGRKPAKKEETPVPSKKVETKSSVKQSESSPAKKSVSSPAKKSVSSPAKKPVSSPAKKPVSSPAKKSESSPVKKSDVTVSATKKSEFGQKAQASSAKQEKPSKRGRKQKEASESENGEEEQEIEIQEEEDDEEEKVPKKGGKKKVEKFKKGQQNPNVPNVIKVDETFEGNSQEIQENCCSFCTNREMLRAVNTGNHALLKKLIQSKAKISTLFAKRGPDSDETVLEIILKNKDKKALDLMIGVLQKKSDLQLASNPECSLDEAYTGYNDRFAYGVPTRKVQLSRGGKEGNNAFVADINGFVETSKWHENQRLIYSLLENETEVQFLEFLRGLQDEQLSKSLLEKTYVAVRAGNRKTAAYLMEQANKFGGYGFNKVHEQVLTLDDPSKMDDFKKVSATKKSNGVYSNNSYGYGGAQGIITPIHCAAINPNPEFIKKLLDISPEYTIPDDNMRKPVHYAATCEGPGPLTYLMKQGVDTREGDKKKNTPLMLACQFGRSKNVEILLDGNGKSNPDTRTRDGMKAIHFAAHYGHLECVKLMIEKGGVDVDSPGPKRMTALHIASSRGHFEMVEYLLSKEAKIISKDKFKRSAVIHATANGQLKILSLILKNGGPFNDPDSSNNYPVHYAAAYGFQACLDLLKQAGADFNPQNSWNLTPLSVAMAKGHFGMVKKLLNYPECDVNCTDVQGRTIISRATEKLNLHNLKQFEFILKDKKANPNMSDLQGQSPLHYLCSLQKDSYIQKRQKEENKYNITKQYEKEYEEIIEKATQILLECGADINKLNTHFQSPLILSIKKKNFFILNMLLKKGGLDFSFINLIDQNIFHILGSLIMEGPTGITQFENIFEEIKKDKKVNIKEYLNKADYHGFTPLLIYVKTFSENAVTYKNQRFEEIKKELFEKKGGQNKSSKQKGAQLSGFTTDGSLVQLSEKEIEKALQQSEEELTKFEQEFQKFITFIVNQGADIEAKVLKIKKYRDTMEIEEDEDNKEKQDEDDDDQYDNIDNTQFERDYMGNPIVKKSKSKYTSQYNAYGENNLFSLALSHLSLSYLKQIAENYPQLVNNIDYLKRNHLSKFIIENQDNPESKDKPNNANSILEWMCSLKIDINHRDIIESTPLITAIAQNKLEFAKSLINHKAEINVKDIFGKSPLIMAINSIKSNNLEFIEFLLSKGANTNFKDNYGRTSLHHAVNVADKGANASFDLENLLIKNGADINNQDQFGRTPLHYCFIGMNQHTYVNTQYDPFETVSSLCNQPQIQINVKDGLGKTALHYAAQKNSSISTIYMIEKGADINIEDMYKNTPLSVSFRFQRSEITTTFIQNKADTSKMINIYKNLKENGEEYDEEKEVQKDAWGNPIRRGRGGGFRYQSYGNRYLNYNDSHYQTNDTNDEQNIINVLLSEYTLKEETYTSLILSKLDQEQHALTGSDKFKFHEFKEKGTLPVGKHSYFKAAITYQWQGIAYLLLIKSAYNLFNALEDAINIDLYQLSITLLFKYPDDKTITQTNSEGQNLLHILCKRPPKETNLQVKLLETLLARNVDPKQLDNKKNLCLHFGYNHPEITPKLLELGLDCNSYNDLQTTPFSLAMMKVPQKALNIYSSKYKPDFSKKFKAKASGQNEELMFTPLLYQFANKNKDLNLLNTLLNSGSNINEVDSLGRNSLYYAIYHNNEKLVKFILQTKKFDIKQLDNSGKNAIHYVVSPVEFGSYENVEILEILKNEKFELNLKDKDGNTPMSYAQLQDSKKMAEALKSYNVDIPKDKKLPKRAATSIVATADFPEEEVDFDEDSKKFSEDSSYDKYKEFIDKKNIGDQVEFDKYVQPTYKKKQNYVVLDENNEPYNLLMTKVDLGFGGYSKFVFYIMQILFDKNTSVYILYTRWGYMGSMGQMQHTPYPNKEGAVKEFSKIFLQKSGNEWTDRHNFKKQEKKYQLQTFEKKNKRAFTIKQYDFETLNCRSSILDKPIFEFMKVISNAEIFKSAYRQFALTDRIMPLTQLSKTALIEAQGILADLLEEAQEIQDLRTKLTQGNNMQLLLEREENVLRLSNRYYELVPRNVSKMEPVQPLSHLFSIQPEQRLVENLIDFEAAIKIIMGSFTKLTVCHPLDYCFSSLSIRMKQIVPEHPEYKMIHEYISRTNKNILKPDSKLIKNIFAVERRGEAERIKQFSDYTKKLLWHGSGVQNLLSIFTFGLRINGIHAQKSGSFLGDGIYFSDLYSKASNYANNLNSDEVQSKFILLCEVAVGKEQQIKTQENYEEYSKQNYQLKRGFNSIKLVGKQCPDEKKNLILPNGTIVPIGNIIDLNERLKQKLQNTKSTKKSTKKKVAKNQAKTPKIQQLQQFSGTRVSTGGKAPRLQLASLAPAIKSVPQNDEISDEESIDIENDGDINQDVDEDMNEEEEIKLDGENEELQEDDDDEDDYEDNINNQNNFLSSVPKQNTKTPFNKLFTQYDKSEYVVFNAAQVRIRYLLEICE